jgi:hypothetical protein
MSFEAVRKLTEFTGATAAAEDLAALAGGVFMPIEIDDGDLFIGRPRSLRRVRPKSVTSKRITGNVQ